MLKLQNHGFNLIPLQTSPESQRWDLINSNSVEQPQNPSMKTEMTWFSHTIIKLTYSIKKTMRLLRFIWNVKIIEKHGGQILTDSPKS